MTSYKELFFLIACILCFEYSTAQVSGYKKDNFIIKSDFFPLTEKGYDGMLEIAFLRQFSATVSFEHSNKSYRQKLEPYFFEFGTYPDDKGTIVSNTIEFGLRYYINKSLPAPIGPYVNFWYGFGKAKMKGNYYLLAPNGTLGNEYLDYDIEEVKIKNVFLGTGYQIIVLKRLVLDGTIGLEFASLDADSFNYAISATGNNHGPNLISLGQWHNNLSGGIGPSIELRVGLLLF